MSLQIIKSTAGKDEYVLLPIHVFRSLAYEIKEKMQNMEDDNSYVPFNLADYVDNPVAYARIQARLTQEELAKRMRVTQAYISKIESQAKVTPKLMQKVKEALTRS